VAEPVVSIVIPTRNRLRFLQEAVESVRRQTYPNWELIVVDDCSEDDTWAWLSSLHDPFIRPVSLERHSERSAARNRGFANVRGEFVLFLDDDDRLDPRALERLVRVLPRHPHTVAVVGARVVFDERGHRRRVSHTRIPLVCGVWREVLLGWAAISGQVLFRRGVLAEVGGWNERLTYAEDHELLLRVSRRGPIAFVPHTVLYNRVHPGQTRPVDAGGVEEELRRAYVAALPAKEHAEGEVVLIARRHLLKAWEDWRAGSAGTTFVHALRASRFVPQLVVSPVFPIAPDLLRFAAGAMAGKRGVHAIKVLRAWWRQILRRDPEAGRRARIHGSAPWADGDDSF